MPECGGCRYFDPTDGYCVMNADYRKAADLCVEYAEPKKWIFLMEEKGGKYNADG